MPRRFDDLILESNEKYQITITLNENNELASVAYEDDDISMFDDCGQTTWGGGGKVTPDNTWNNDYLVDGRRAGDIVDELLKMENING